MRMSNRAAGEKRDDVRAAGGDPFEVGEVDPEREPGGGIFRVEARDAAVDQQAAERHHERLQLQFGDQQAVDQPHQDADPQHQHRRGRPPDALVGDQIDKDDAEQRDDRADRQLDAARDDHESLADGEYSEQTDQIGGVGDVDRRQEPGIDDRDHRPDDDDQHQQTQVFLQHSPPRS